MATFDGKFQHDPERRERIAALWKEGLSAAKIAALIGGISRGGVLGLVHRLGLSGGALPPRRAQPRKRVKNQNETSAKARVVRVKSAPVTLNPLPLAEHDAERPCLWPCGDEPEAMICGRTRDPQDWRSQYCRDHREMAVRPQRGGVVRLRERPAPDLSGLQIARPFGYREAGTR